MRLIQNNYIKVLTLTLTTLYASSSFSAGFEKSILWSAEHAGRGGTAVSTVSGPDSIFFNPAGIADQNTPHAISINFSPVSSQFKGPVVASDQIESTPTVFSPVYGLLYGGKLNEKFGFAIGGFVSGGNKASYEDIAIPGSTGGKASLESDIAIQEFSIGGAYKLTEDLSFGIAWRQLFLNARQKIFSYASAATYLQTTLEDIKASKSDGLRIGIKYAPQDQNWGLGLNYRNSVTVTGKGKWKDTAVHLTSNGAVAQAFPDADGEVDTVFPQQVTFGGHYAWEHFTLFPEIVWTNYSQVDRLAYRGLAVVDEIKTDWRDQYNFRLGGEYTGWSWPLRFGYVHTTQVVPGERANATFSAPGTGHQLTVGSGYKFEENMSFDFALEHSWAKGDKTADPDNALAPTGEVTNTATGIHLSFNVGF